MNIVDKQRLFDELMEKLNVAGEIKSPAKQFRAMMDIENFLESVYERGYKEGFEKAVNQSIDVLKN